MVTQMERIDVAVIGGGVTGLASARAIAAQGYSTCILERHPRPGLDTSTRNSGVIHGGIYYPAGSLKARLCVEGRHALYEFCAAHSVPHAKIGKLIVANDDHELSAIEALHAKGAANGVEGLRMVDAGFVSAREPQVHAIAALYSPESGIVDAEALVKTLLRLGEAAGVIFLPGTKLLDAAPRNGGVELRTERETIMAVQVVNAAGLYADEVSKMVGGEAFTIYPCRGEYAEFIPARRSLVKALVYPPPLASGHGLGVHLLKTVDGSVWLGPTAKYQLRKDDYDSDRLPVDAFVEPARRLLKNVNAADMRVAGSGIRAKLHPPEQSFADFMIKRDVVNPSIVQAAGIESPGLTSCLAVGRLVAEIVAEGR
jgi:L-2-hydroxyglutarate oxidase LhgO